MKKIIFTFFVITATIFIFSVIKADEYPNVSSVYNYKKIDHSRYTNFDTFDYNDESFAIQDYKDSLWGINIVKFNNELIVTDDDPITSIIPRDFFIYRGEYLYIGANYAFFVNTKEYMDYSNVVNILLIDIEKTESMSVLEYSIAPIFQSTYYYLTNQDNFKYKDEYELSNDTYNNSLIIPEIFIENTLMIHKETENLSLKNILIINKLENEYHLNYGDSEYEEQDDELFFTKSELLMKSGTSEESRSFISFLREPLAFSPIQILDYGYLYDSLTIQSENDFVFFESDTYTKSDNRKIAVSSSSSYHMQDSFNIGAENIFKAKLTIENTDELAFRLSSLIHFSIYDSTVDEIKISEKYTTSLTIGEIDDVEIESGQAYHHYLYQKGKRIYTFIPKQSGSYKFFVSGAVKIKMMENGKFKAININTYLELVENQIYKFEIENFRIINFKYFVKIEFMELSIEQVYLDVDTSLHIDNENEIKYIRFTNENLNYKRATFRIVLTDSIFNRVSSYNINARHENSGNYELMEIQIYAQFEYFEFELERLGTIFFEIAFQDSLDLDLKVCFALTPFDIYYEGIELHDYSAIDISGLEMNDFIDFEVYWHGLVVTYLEYYPYYYLSYDNGFLKMEKAIIFMEGLHEIAIVFIENSKNYIYNITLDNKIDIDIDFKFVVEEKSYYHEDDIFIECTIINNKNFSDQSDLILKIGDPFPNMEYYEQVNLGNAVTTVKFALPSNLPKQLLEYGNSVSYRVVIELRLGGFFEYIIKSKEKDINFYFGNDLFENPYRKEHTISSAYHLNNIRYFSDSPHTPFILTNNINLGNKTWQPIEKFSGIIYGNNHVISNIKILHYNNSGLVGFFEELNRAHLSNINFYGITIETYYNVYRVGAIAGTSINSSIDSCNISYSIKANSATVGGVIGFSSNSGITNVHVTDSSIINEYRSVDQLNIGFVATGGLIGFEQGSVYFKKVSIKKTSITKSYENELAHSNASVGGLIGYAQDIKVDDVQMLDSSIIGNYNRTLSNSNISLGGLIGYAENANINKVNIKNSPITGNYNKGLINSNISLGGLIGYTQRSYIYDVQMLDSSITGNCEDMVLQESNLTIGGLIGYVQNSHINFVTMSSPIKISCLPVSDMKLVAVGGVIGLAENSQIERLVIGSNCSIYFDGSRLLFSPFKHAICIGGVIGVSRNSRTSDIPPISIIYFQRYYPNNNTPLEHQPSFTPRIGVLIGRATPGHYPSSPLQDKINRQYLAVRQLTYVGGSVGEQL